MYNPRANVPKPEGYLKILLFFNRLMFYEFDVILRNRPIFGRYRLKIGRLESGRDQRSLPEPLIGWQRQHRSLH